MENPQSPEPEAVPLVLPSGPTETPPRHPHAPGPSPSPIKRACETAVWLADMTGIMVMGITLPQFLMVIALLSQIWAAYTVAVGISSAACQFAVSLSTVLSLGSTICQSSAESFPAITAEAADKALAAMDCIAPEDAYFLDSACSYSILMGTNPNIIDIHDIQPRTIEGLTGTQTLTKAGTLFADFPDTLGNPHAMQVPECLVDDLATQNLVAVKQLNNAGYAVLFLPHEATSGLITPPRFWHDCEPVCLPVIQRNNVFLLTPMECDCPYEPVTSQTSTKP
eukprot:547563-Rhodomonas_salina.1